MAVGEGSIRVEGLRELNAHLKEFDKVLQRELQKAIREIAEPVAEETRSRLSGIGVHDPTISGIKAGSRLGAAVVRQRARATTHKRGDFGVTQMRYGFLPALKDKEPETIARVEHLLGELTTRFNA